MIVISITPTTTNTTTTTTTPAGVGQRLRRVHTRGSAVGDDERHDQDRANVVRVHRRSGALDYMHTLASCPCYHTYAY